MTISGPVVNDSLGLGMVRAAPHLVPAGAAWTLENFLLDVDGSAYRRGGTTYKSAAFSAAAGVLTLIFDGQLVGGARTVVATTEGLGLLGADDTSTTMIGPTTYIGPDVRPVVMKGVLFMHTSLYGGSRATGADYTTGTVAVTKGSTTVTGTGTTWSTAVADAGRLLVINGQVVPIAARVSNTQVTLAWPWPIATASGLAYSLKTVASVTDITGNVYGEGRTVAGGRLITASGDTVYASEIDNFSLWSNVDGIPNQVKLPGGVVVTGAATIGDTAIVFTTGGVWALSNIALDPVDDAGNVQWSLEVLSRDLVLLTNAGIAEWQGGLLVPAVDGLWLVSLSGSPVLMSRSITPYWASMVTLGRRPGQAAVFAGHYLMPVTDAFNGPVDLMVCRLDRPVGAQLGTVWPWTTWAGAGGRTVAMAVRVGTATRTPVLFAGSTPTVMRLVQHSPFAPDGGEGVEYDGTQAGADYQGRDQATSPTLQNLNTVKKIGVRYFLSATTGTPTIFVSWASAARLASGATTGWTVLSTGAAANDGGTVAKWHVNKKLRFLRIRVQCTTKGYFSLYSTEAYIRQSGTV